MDTFIRAYTLKHWSTHVVTLIQVHIPRDPPSGTRSDSALRPSKCSTVFAFEYIHRSCFCICVIVTHTDIDTWVHACMQYIALHYVTLHYILTYIHTYTHTCMHACIHAYMHTCIHARMHACMHAHLPRHHHAETQTPRAQWHAYLHIYIPPWIHADMHTYT